jgi:hypothetical protein
MPPMELWAGASAPEPITRSTPLASGEINGLDPFKLSRVRPDRPWLGGRAAPAACPS